MYENMLKIPLSIFLLSPRLNGPSFTTIKSAAYTAPGQSVSAFCLCHAPITVCVAYCSLLLQQDGTYHHPQVFHFLCLQLFGLASFCLLVCIAWLSRTMPKLNTHAARQHDCIQQESTTYLKHAYLLHRQSFVSVVSVFKRARTGNLAKPLLIDLTKLPYLSQP